MNSVISYSAGRPAKADRLRYGVVWILMILVGNLSVHAQEWGITRSTGNEEFHRTHAQQGVKISTDVLLVAMPVAALTGVLVAKDWTGLKQGAFTAAASVGTTMILKYAVKERRPDGSNWHSFPSGHSSTTFATAAFLQRRYGWKFGAPAYALATYTAWGRVFAKKHHWWDVVVGAGIGAGSAYIFTRPWAREHNLSIAPATDGHTFLIATSFTL